MMRGKSQRSIEIVNAAYGILEEIEPASVRVNELGYRVLSGTIPTPLPETEMTRAQVAQLLRDLMDGGRLGRKQRQRAHQLLELLT
jgi:hypothetical protein